MADEVSHTKPWQRISVFIIALLFILTSGALTALVIVQAVSSKNKGSSSQPQAAASCSIGQVSGQALPAPKAEFTSPPVKLIQTKDLATGSGPTAKSGDCLTVKYYGTLASSGKVFDEDFTQSSALKFQLGKQQVISGWDIGLVGMKVGSERRLVLSPDLAYGKTGSGTIPPNATLVFIVKLLKINS